MAWGVTFFCPVRAAWGIDLVHTYMGAMYVCRVCVPCMANAHRTRVAACVFISQDHIWHGNGSSRQQDPFQGLSMMSRAGPITASPAVGVQLDQWLLQLLSAGQGFVNRCVQQGGFGSWRFSQQIEQMRLQHTHRMCVQAWLVGIEFAVSIEAQAS